MHTLEVLETGQKLEFPSKIAELSAEQYMRFCYDFCRLQDMLITQDDFMVALIFNCLEMKPLKNRKMKEDEEYRLVMNMEYLFDALASFWHIPDGEKDAIIDWFFADQKVPVLEWGGKKFFGPSNHLQDLTYGEYEKAHTYYSVYLRDNDVVMLDKLIAVLYRPEMKSTFGLVGTGQKIDLEKHDTDAAEAWVTKLPFYMKYAVFVWWNNMEQFIRMAEINTDAGPVQLGILFEKSEDSGSKIEDNTGIRGVLYHLAESAVFGTIKDVERTKFWDVMLRLYQMRKSHESQKARIKELQSKQGGEQ